MYEGARACRDFEFEEFIIESKIIDRENPSLIKRIINDLIYERACYHQLLKNGLYELSQNCGIVNVSEEKTLKSYKKGKI
ncbi:MAG TPA: hypothetical protein VJB11_00550 [archaeon]|nr:hypothetical protein [archaeon]